MIYNKLGYTMQPIQAASSTSKPVDESQASNKLPTSSFSKLPIRLVASVAQFVLGDSHLSTRVPKTDMALFQLNRQSKEVTQAYFKRVKSASLELFDRQALQSAMKQLNCTRLSIKAFSLPNYSLQPLVEKQNHFVALELYDLGKTPDRDIAALIQAQKNLRELSLNQCNQISNKTIQQLCQTLPELRSLSLNWRVVHYSPIPHGNATPDAFSSIAKLEHLEHLTVDISCFLNQDPFLIKEVFRQVVQLKQLKTLFLSDAFRQDAADIRLFADHLGKLESLRLFPKEDVQDAGYEYLFERNKNLKKLELIALNCSEKGLQTLRHLGQLEELVIQGAKNLTNQSLQDLSMLPKLKTVHLDKCNKITKEGVDAWRASTKSEVTFTDKEEAVRQHPRMYLPPPYMQPQFMPYYPAMPFGPYPFGFSQQGPWFPPPGYFPPGWMG
jgi:hypothetical protein